eukprot:CAMPEP_0203940240 /NCGR_PEP_ID=MMETSP0359-20131031/76885_1 /ASSEMBLY_ACC=CAM_ASM_000338 /TAXON_ID=268821 /ORGANISM="Scrippsiella Hangoei, Strain SHTV-5" /LENGTH=97 /DNA_ID=CAMNT_0050870653 /DNA_START=62 /DNA_END=353 /DNA_ORIENTATION=+
MRPHWYIHASGNYAERQAGKVLHPTERCNASQDKGKYLPAKTALNGKRRFCHTDWALNASQGEAAVVQTCKRRLRQTASVEVHGILGKPFYEKYDLD